MEDFRDMKDAGLQVSTGLKDATEQGVIGRLVASYRRSADADGRIHLRDYMQAVRKHLWLIAGLTLLVTMVTVIYLARQPDIFLSQALVQIDVEEINPALANNKNNSVIVNNTANDPAYFNTQLRILTSYGLLSRVVKTLDLENNQAFTNPKSVQTRSTWQNMLRMVGLGKKERSGETDGAKNKLPVVTVAKTAAAPGIQTGQTEQTGLAGLAGLMSNPEETERYAPLVKSLTEDLQIEPVVERRMGYGRDTTRLIEIRYKHPDPRLAARIANTVADTLALTNLERKADKSVSTGEFLQKRIAELQMQIRNGEERLLNYAKSNQIISLDASQNTVVDRLTGLNRQLLEAENERKLAESAWQAARSPGAAMALAEETVSKQTADIKTRLAELRQKRAQLLVENTEKWPEVNELKQQIATLEQELQTAIGRATAVVLSNLETRYRQAAQREQAVRADFEKQRGATLTQNEAAVNYHIIQQEIETNKGLLNGLLQNYKENDVVLAGLHNNVSVLDYAIPPDNPIGPKRWQGVLLALLFSIPCGIGLVLLLEYLNDTIRSIDDVEKLVRLPALAAIPAIKGSRSMRGGRSVLMLGEKAPGDKLTPVALEAYRQLRTAVLLSNPGRAPKTMLITSSVPGEGKTTSAVNLAISLAQTKASVLLVDADLRRPRLHTIFGLANRQGLSTYLSSETPVAESQTLLQRHEASNLSVLTSGPVPPNPAELLGSDQMRRLLQHLESQFTYIVIDSAPSASFTDAVLLSAMVDGLLMVIHCNSTPRNLVLRTKHLLTGAGAKIFGVVLSQVVMASPDAIYGSYLYKTSEKALSGSLADQQAEEGGVKIIKSAFSTTAESPKADETPIAKKDPAELARPVGPLNGKRARASSRTRGNVAARPANGAKKDNGIDGASGARPAAFAWEHLNGSGGTIAEMAASGLVHEIINNLTSADSQRSCEAYSMLLLMVKAGGSRPLLHLIEVHPDEQARLALIKLLSTSGDAEALRGLVHIAVQKASSPKELSAVLTAIDRLASQNAGTEAVSGSDRVNP
jgi:capsular exopolysaccharide synthesis family protein